MNMIVIDTRSRKLETFIASVTRGKDGLVVRQALEVPLGGLVKSVDYRGVKMPLMVLGCGYQACSSAGAVRVLTGARGSHDSTAASIKVVGFLPFKGPLFSVNIDAAVMAAGAELVEVKTFTNSNVNSANALLNGLDVLADAERSAILIAEGQSDSLWVVKIKPPKDRTLAWEDFESEHNKMFWPEPDNQDVPIELEHFSEA